MTYYSIDYDPVLFQGDINLAKMEARQRNNRRERIHDLIDLIYASGHPETAQALGSLLNELATEIVTNQVRIARLEANVRCDSSRSR